MENSDKDYVNLDVGQFLYTCHIAHLRRFPGTVLERLVAVEHDTRKTGCDYIKIHRDGKLFGTILNYLREPNPNALKGFNSHHLRQLEIEADFYGLEGLIQICKDFINEQEKSGGSLEIIFGLDGLRTAFKTIDLPTLILNMDRFVELAFFDSMQDVVGLCALNNLPVIGYKRKEQDLKKSRRQMILDDDNDINNNINNNNNNHEENDNNNDEDEFTFDASSLNALMTLVDQNMQIKHQLDVARFTRNDDFLKKVLKFLIAIMTLNSDES